MNKRLYLLALILLATLLLSLSCSQRLTKQFIYPRISKEIAAPEKNIGEWLLEHPSVIAYKHKVKIIDIENQNQYWVTLRAKHFRGKNKPVKEDLKIDSIVLTLYPGEEIFVRFPTRAVSYDSRNGKDILKAFDFFGDQGVVIPPDISSILFSFEASIVINDKVTESKLFEYKMLKDESSEGTLFLKE